MSGRDLAPTPPRERRKSGRRENRPKAGREKRRSPSFRRMSKRRMHANGGSGRATPRKAVQGRRVTPSRTPEDTVRTLAAWVVDRTLETMAPSNVYLASALARLDEPDHGLLRELALGTLRWKRRLDYVISRASHRSFDRIEPALRTPLRLGAYQLLFLDRIPHHAAVHEAVDHARIATHKGGASFTNAVLRRIARHPTLEAWPVEESDPVRRLAIENSHPDFLVQRWSEQFGRSATESLAAGQQPPQGVAAAGLQGSRWSGAAGGAADRRGRGGGAVDGLAARPDRPIRQSAALGVVPPGTLLHPGRGQPSRRAAAAAEAG